MRSKERIAKAKQNNAGSTAFCAARSQGKDALTWASQMQKVGMGTAVNTEFSPQPLEGNGAQFFKVSLAIKRLPLPKVMWAVVLTT